MTDHTRTEKIGGDSIFIFGSFPSRSGKPLWHYEWGIYLKSDNLAQKTYFHNLVEQRDGTFPRLLFLEKWILWKSSILKRFIFVVPEYDNLTSVKIHRDRFKSSGEGFLERGVQIFGFGEGKGPHRGFECCPVVALSFFCLLCPRVFENFLASALDCPFGFSP